MASPRAVLHKQIREMIDGAVSDKTAKDDLKAAQAAAEVEAMSEKDLGKRIKLLEKQMLEHARNLEFEKAARRARSAGAPARAGLWRRWARRQCGAAGAGLNGALPCPPAPPLAGKNQGTDLNLTNLLRNNTEG